MRNSGGNFQSSASNTDLHKLVVNVEIDPIDEEGSCQNYHCLCVTTIKFDVAVDRNNALKIY